MTAFLVLFAAALSRLLPHHYFHAVGINFTAVGAGLLFFGSRSPRWQALLAVVTMALTDVYLTTKVYGMAFHVEGYLITWAWYGLLCLLASGLLQKVSFLRVAAGVLTSSIGFYVFADIMPFLRMYPHTLGGLKACYVAALPFLWNDMASTAFFAAVLFGAPVLAAKLTEAMDSQSLGNRLA
ncbi:hypothetical protein SAMN05421819_3822 [Bryocella elongata]|uniref:Uncharacterized protein n=1 Tax=Bryocella elongata TaxID=863522 RepID=A0A1H6BLK7_9BACT|nr:DUF6580 family putative transport protein [Bryocella elongata]SEG61609.1 hypothetical protein SAMN05421819_3822 [Bryocella elongata]